MTDRYDRFLLAYFLSEQDEHGEQIRFAVSHGATPTSWNVLNEGEPVLVSNVGERGVRDPFLVRDHRTGACHLLATDLRIWPSQDWTRTMRTGSRSIVAWSSADLVAWSSPRLIPLAPAEAGNTWAPKAIWSDERDCWMVVWASALFYGEDRSAGSYQRIMTAPTQDFTDFGPAEIYLDLGHDVIDAAFLRDGPDWYRFSANAQPVRDADPTAGSYIFIERGRSFDDPDYRPVAVAVGRTELEHGEGPAVARAADGSTYLLIDEHGLRGYQLFHTPGPLDGPWRHIADAHLPDGARHGSLLAITQDEAERLLKTEW